jgi:mannan endo-1,4-beta-mannosidase
MHHRPIAAASGAIAALLLIAACTSTTATAAKTTAPSTSAVPVPSATLPVTPGHYIGVIGAGIPASYTPVLQFAAVIDAPVSLAGYYSGWGEQFQLKFAQTAWAHGTTTLVNMDPSHLGIIESGGSDTYLRRFAAQVKAFGHPVVISFGHEANGDWFSYGYKHAKPADYVKAYRVVHDVMTAAGATNVIWLWTVNIPVPNQTESFAAVYPGAQYVTWAGIDGYDWTGKATFAQEFATTITDVKHDAPGKPILIAETSVVPGPNAGAQTAGLFAGIKRDGLLGLVWYDIDKVGFKGTADTHDWELQNDPPALAAFRAAIKPTG